MKKSFSDESWSRFNTTVEAIKNHPFLTELTKGTLSKNIFKAYLTQDILYSGLYSSYLEKLSHKITEPKYSSTIFDISQFPTAEMMKKQFIESFGHEPEEKMSQVCKEYTEHIKSCVDLGPSEGLSAMLPCFLVYYRIGKMVAENEEKGIKNDYQWWIDWNVDKEYEKQTNQYIEIVDFYAEKDNKMKEKMMDIFCKSIKMEYEFFNDPYVKGNN